MRKDTIGVCCLLVSTAMILMIAWFFQAHPVVASPENTRIMFIEIGGGEDEDFTIPSPEQEKQILAFLSTCKETHTTRRELSGGYDASWKCMTIMLAFPNGQFEGFCLLRVKMKKLALQVYSTRHIQHLGLQASLIQYARYKIQKRFGIFWILCYCKKTKNQQLDS